MADEKIGLGVGLASTADTTGPDRMADALDKTKESARGAGEAAKKLEIDYQSLGESIRLLVEGAGLIEFLRESVAEFYEDEKAMRAVTGAALVLGEDQKKAREETEKFTRALSLLSGVADNELTVAVGRAYIATGDLHQAMSRASLAADVALRGHMEFGKAVTIVEQAVNGQGRELAKLGLDLRNAKDDTERATKAVDFLEKNFRGATEATKDHALAADQAHVKWQLFQKEIGGALLPAINWVRDGLKDLTNWWQKMGEYAGTVLEGAVQQTRALGTTIELLLKGKITDAGTFFGAEVAKIARNTTESLADIDKKYAAKRVDDEKELLKTVHDGANERLRINDDLRKKEEKAEKTHYSFLESNTKNFLKEWAKFQKNRADMAKETDDDILRHFTGHTSKELEIEAQTEAQSDRIRKAALAKIKAAKKLELEMSVDVANAAIGLATDLFGASKETAIASAIVNTYEGATKALAQGGIYGAVLAAIVIAAGLAQVAKIESSEPASAKLTTSGAGFDDPANDQAAYMGGRRWANDMISKFTSGVSQGWASGMGGGGGTTYNQTYDNSRRTTINASIQDPSNIESVKKLIRTIKMVDSNVLGQTTIAARTR